MSSVNVRSALENALKAMAPLLAASTITTSTVAAATVITTAAPHSLVTGMYVAILGHAGSTPAIIMTSTRGRSHESIPSGLHRLRPP